MVIGAGCPVILVHILVVAFIDWLVLYGVLSRALYS